jgi:tripartite-type tricarboxylate transporter receptor subunit TctC
VVCTSITEQVVIPVETIMQRLRDVALCIGLQLMFAFGGIAPSQAQADYPARPIRIVMPLPGGTALDVVTRAVGEQLTGQLGQPIVVENRPGAGGQLAAQAVASAPADGYTLLGGASSIWTILPAQKKDLPFDVNRDFVQIGMIVGSGPMYIAVSPKLGVNSFPELAALAKSKAGQIVFGTNGAGSLPHFAAMALAKQASIPITVVPYNQGGTVAAVADIMGGRVHATIEAIFGLRGQVQSGDLKLIAVMSPERDPVHPDIPTVASVVPGVDAVGFMSLAAPAGTPAPAVDRLAKALRLALDAPAVKQRFADLGIHVKSMTPAETTAFIAAQEKVWWPLVREFEAK